MGMSYRKIKKVPFLGNTERCLVLRHIWARRFFEILDQGYRIINIDETWIPDTDFRSHQWKKRGLINTRPDRPIGSRTNLIVALCSDGEVYVSVL